MINLKLLIWVTSVCNLKCPLCNQQHSIRQAPEYQMGMSEVENIVASCKRRGIRFSVIELIGGEPSMWTHLEEGIKALGEITDDLFFVTNGVNAERVMALGLRHWIVSASQATKAQLCKYEGVFDRVILNAHTHRHVPTEAVPDTVPASCVVAVSPFDAGVAENGMGYFHGRVYYCQLVYGLSDRVPVTEDMVCDFEEDFVGKFSGKAFDKEVCKYCLCNAKVWAQIT